MPEINAFDQILADWLREETTELVAQGAQAEDVSDPAFQQLVRQRVWQRHSDEVGASEPFRQHVWAVYLKVATAQELREAAAILRREGDDASAYQFEERADQRERGSENTP
jgi:hypothetical protein